MDNRVPTTPEEAEQKFREICGGDNVASQSMAGILRLRMKMGETFHEAYEAALKAYLKAAGVNL